MTSHNSRDDFANLAQPTVAMPGGSPIGAAVHAVMDAMTPHPAHPNVPEMVDSLAEENYWREHHREQAFASDLSFEHYALAYHVGFSSYHPDQTFADCEADLRAIYEMGPHDPQLLPWAEVRDAARVAYERVARGEAYHLESTISGTNDGLS
jgi:hypothetical protein